jgi:archaellum component FlaC
MKEWRESKKADENAAFELPDSLSKAVQDSINRMWVTATNLANESVEAYRREADKAVQDADEERDEALNEVGRLEVIVEEFEKALSDQSLKVERLEVKLGQEQSRSSELLTEKASMEADLAGRKEQIERLHNDVDVLRQDYRALQSELIQMAKAGKDRSEE